MIYGYARVSTKKQDLTAQLMQLKEYGCGQIFQEHGSGRNKERPQFQALLEVVERGDTVVVCKLDRFARSTIDALNTINMLNEKGVSMVVLNMGGEKLDTSTPIGKLLVTMLAGIAEFEADMIRERQLEGIAIAKAAGVYKGRPKKYGKSHKGLQHALELLRNRVDNGMTVADICAVTGVGRSTLYKFAQEM